MDIYDFEGTDFALSSRGIHLLRSRYNYKTIEYENVQKAVIERGTEIHNVIVAFVLGVGLVTFAFFQTLYIIRLFNDPNAHTIYIESIVLPLLPALIGSYLIYIAIKKRPILIIKSGKMKQKLRLREFIRNNKIEDLKNYLSQKLSYKLSIDDIDI